MTVSAQMLLAGANKQLEAYNKAAPVDQVNKDKPLMQWLVANKKPTIGGNYYYNEKVHVANDSNYQNYSEDDQVSYNRRDTVRLAKFGWASFHDGFGVNEDELARNGINISEDGNASTVTDAETVQIYNVMEQNYTDLKMGVQEKFDEELHLDGTQDPKAVQGLDLLVSTDPANTTVGGIDAGTATYWRNNVALNIPAVIDEATAVGFIAALETLWRACRTYGRKTPDKIICGATFYDNYRAALNLTQDRHITIVNKTGKPGQPSLDGGTGEIYFKDVVVEWDPTMDSLDDLYGPPAISWKKRCYFLNSTTLKLRPLIGHWMVNRKPPRMYDRYVYYFAMTSKYRMTINQRNANGVASVA
jgi:hypothetical protein